MKLPLLIFMLTFNGSLSVKTTLLKVKYLNNIIEQDHRFFKPNVKSMLGFDSFETAEKQFAGLRPCI